MKKLQAELIKKNEDNYFSKRHILRKMREDNWKKVMDSTNKILTYFLLTGGSKN